MSYNPALRSRLLAALTATALGAALVLPARAATTPCLRYRIKKSDTFD